MNKEKELIDMLFQAVAVCTEDPVFCARPIGERMAWVANRLRAIGIDTHPVGASWGMVVGKEFRESHPVVENDLDKLL